MCLELFWWRRDREAVRVKFLWYRGAEKQPQCIGVKVPKSSFGQLGEGWYLQDRFRTWGCCFLLSFKIYRRRNTYIFTAIVDDLLKAITLTLNENYTRTTSLCIQSYATDAKNRGRTKKGYPSRKWTCSMYITTSAEATFHPSRAIFHPMR